jgi:hypothetical protein
MVSVLPARKPRVVYPSSIGASASPVPISISWK